MSKQQKKASDQLNEYSGHLETYHEMGMECIGAILHDDRGIKPNEDYTEDGKNGPKNFQSLSWAIFFRRHAKYNIVIYDDKGEVFYSGPLSASRERMKEFSYRYSFMPNEISPEDWFTCLGKKYKAKVKTNELVMAQDPEYKDYV